ncbi:hypothetical protein AKJ09_07256 [Labilithrix luteola]|uniref:Outer membrane protein beta-barrel domain-containing protein n=1 Tax=Labilithrix luteola TaxID=1391654 RepID=A0A0K1Q4D1_9BACT|nr:hypothetical protein [Labilithrix luteola]AKV00593.1 hypothetical protein AKJ09_07256 [Labilithrix luteola]
MRPANSLKSSTRSSSKRLVTLSAMALVACYARSASAQSTMATTTQTAQVWTTDSAHTPVAPLWGDPTYAPFPTGFRRPSVAATTTTTSATAPGAQAAPGAEPTQIARDWAVYGNLGGQTSVTPGIVFVSGNVGGSLNARLGWGFDTGRILFVPNLQFASYFYETTAVVAMVATKFVLPLRTWSTFVEAGIGMGHVDNPQNTGAAYVGGGGVVYHLSPVLAVGGEIHYQGISSASFNALSLGPMLSAAL